MEILSSHEAVAEMLHLMEVNGRHKQAVEISDLISCVFRMEVNYEVLLKAEDRTFQSPESLGLRISGQTRQEHLSDLGDQIQTLRGKVITCAERAVKDYGQKGASALDTAISALSTGARGLLGSIQEKVSLLKVNKRSPLFNFSDTLLAPIEGQAVKAKDVLERLDHTAKTERKSGERPSILQRLKNKPAPARSAPRTVRKSYEAER